MGGSVRFGRAGYGCKTVSTVSAARRPAQSTAPSPGPARLAALAVVVTALGLTVWLHARYPDALVTLLPSPDMAELHVDFDTFWHSAVALVHGGDLYDTPAKLTNLNPPVLSVLLAPFAATSSLVGYRIFAVLTALMVVGAVLAVTRELRLSPRTQIAVLGVVLASSPLHGTLVLGQIYGMLLVGLVAGWIADRRGHPVVGHALYGVTIAVKPSLAPILLLALVERRWRAFGAGVAAGAAATLVGLVAAGPENTLAWVRIALTEPVPDTVDNASLPGLAVRFGLPGIVGTLAGLVVLAVTVGLLARHRDRVDPAGTAPWALLAAGLLFAPIAWHNYLLLLWPGVLVLARTRAATAAALLAVALIPVSWNAIWPPEGLAADVGRSLYCAILLAHWLLLLRAAVGTPHDAPDKPTAADYGDEDPAEPAPALSVSGTSHNTPVGGSRSSAEAGRP